MNTVTYSLWFKPTGRAYDVLVRTIRELAHELAAPLFEPHVTLLGQLDGTEQDHVRRSEELAGQLQPFQIILIDPSYRNEYFQCLFMRVQQTPAAMSTHALARRVFHRPEDTYMPHLSLLYGVFPDRRKSEVIDRLQPDVRTSFEASAFYLIRAGSDDPKDWHEMAVFPMGGQEPAAGRLLPTAAAD